MLFSLPLPFSLSFTSNFSIYHTVNTISFIFQDSHKQDIMSGPTANALVQTQNEDSYRVYFSCMCPFKPSDRLMELKMPAVTEEQSVFISEI